ncbi:uncharacterized protein A4U43_C01F12610 [Asparagus officinalis]|uniref:Uncharacterized protein n=1 Tax=Asparagus officinalis TaxID=4686 RepID=A0A5P1FQJ2_ASPOF|nr:uncharacterized protein A4U43_C01F12610 [Asparagus officinalis]
MTLLLASFPNFFRKSLPSEVLQVLARIFVVTLHSHFEVLFFYGSFLLPPPMSTDAIGKSRNMAYKRLSLENESRWRRGVSLSKQLVVEDELELIELVGQGVEGQPVDLMPRGSSMVKPFMEEVKEWQEEEYRAQLGGGKRLKW